MSDEKKPIVPVTWDDLGRKVAYAAACLALAGLAYWLGIDCIPCLLQLLP
jgi:hypothetical protein